MIDFDYIVSLSKDENLDVVKTRSNPLEYWKEICYASTFKKGAQVVEVPPTRLDHWRDQFVAMSAEGIQVPVPIEHTKSPERRRGTIVAMRRQKDSKGREALFARFRFRDEEAAKLALTTGASVYVPRAVPSASGKQYKDAIEHVCVTDYPVVSDMDGFQPVVLSFSAAWDESAHPRHDAGSSAGGEFAPKDGGGGDDKLGSEIAEIAAKYKTTYPLHIANEIASKREKESGTPLTNKEHLALRKSVKEAMKSGTLKNSKGREKKLDKNGNYISWTGNSTKPERTHGGRYSVQHSSASGWYVFDNFEDRVVADGLGNIKNATKRAKAEVKNPTALAWDPDDHPRHEPGDPRGGEFAPKIRRTTKEQADALRNERGEKSGENTLKDLKKRHKQLFGGAKPMPGVFELYEKVASGKASADDKKAVELLFKREEAYNESYDTHFNPNKPSFQRMEKLEQEISDLGYGNLLTRDSHVVNPYRNLNLKGKGKTKLSRKKARSGYYPTGAIALSRIDDMTLKELATQAGLDAEQPDDQIILALSRVIANAKGPAQTGAAPQMPMRPAYPMMAPAQAPMPRPFGMAHDNDDEQDEHDEPVALSGSLLKMVKEHRTMVLDDLAAKGFIIPDTRKAMAEKYLDEKVICFSHAPDFNDGFDDAVALIRNNGRVLPTGRTGPQAGVVALSKTSSGDRDYLDEQITSLRKERGLN